MTRLIDITIQNLESHQALVTRLRMNELIPLPELGEMAEKLRKELLDAREAAREGSHD